ncbi:putative GNAT family N-acyltransferase [Peribacillus deserti]|uniref:GNAT family N-acyltransferase n=1 Tax=Peribacillus deserti TaxID=673318 RepID=A0ABS2QEE6_9BACI|nr:putative GNAT family N-acyltransferase [Peribacillus deserti]
MEVLRIEAKDTYIIRHNVLRPNQTIDDCKFLNDEENNTFHLGGFIQGELISIASFYKEKNSGFDDEHQYRLRGMATLPHYRSRKAGSILIKEAELLLQSRKASVWWCNARTSASGYYQKLGLRVHGAIFEIDGIGPHVMMYKNL